jgi:hypothetical protein
VAYNLTKIFLAIGQFPGYNNPTNGYMRAGLNGEETIASGALRNTAMRFCVGPAEEVL